MAAEETYNYRIVPPIDNRTESINDWKALPELSAFTSLKLGGVDRYQLNQEGYFIRLNAPSPIMFLRMVIRAGKDV